MLGAARRCAARRAPKAAARRRAPRARAAGGAARRGALEAAGEGAAALAAAHAAGSRRAARLYAVLQLVGARGTPGAGKLAAAAAYLAVLRAVDERDAASSGASGVSDELGTADAVNALLFRAFEWLGDDEAACEADWALARLAHAQLLPLALPGGGDAGEEVSGEVLPLLASAGWCGRTARHVPEQVDAAFLQALEPALGAEGVAALGRAREAVERVRTGRGGAGEGGDAAVALEAAHALVGARATLVSALGSGLRNDCGDASLAMRQRFRAAETLLERQAGALLAGALEAALEAAAAAAPKGGDGARAAYLRLRGDKGSVAVRAATLCARSLALSEWDVAQCARIEVALEGIEPRRASKAAGVASDDLSEDAAERASVAGVAAAAAAAEGLAVVGATWSTDGGGDLAAAALAILAEALELDAETVKLAEANLFAGGAHAQALRAAEALREITGIE